MSDATSFRPLRSSGAGAPPPGTTAQVEARLSRTNYFDGRLLTAEDLNRDQAYLDGRLLDIGLAGGDGVIAGFALALDAQRRFLSLGNGAGVAPSGRMLLLDRPAGQPLKADLQDLGRLATLNGNRIRGLGSALYAVVLLHREVGTDVAEVFPRDLGAKRESSFNTITELLELALVPLPVRPPGGGSALAARAGLARSLLGRPELAAALPEEGLALGLLATQGGIAAWLDPFLLRRTRRDRFDPAGPQRDLAAQYEALLADVLVDRAGRGLPAAFRASDAFALLPPAGTLPRAALDPVAGSQLFFGETAEVWVTPVRADEVAALQEESLAYGPLDLGSGEPFEVVVLAPLAPADFAQFGRALQQPRADAPAAAQASPFRWPDRIGLPRIDPLRLRLLPQPGAALDTDAETWKAIWEKVPDRLPYIRRPAHAGATGVTAVMLASGFTLPPPPDPEAQPEIQQLRAALDQARQELEAQTQAIAAAEQAKAAAEAAAQAAATQAAAAQARAAQAEAGRQGVLAERDRALADLRQSQADLAACGNRTGLRDDLIDQLRRKLVKVKQPPFPWPPGWPDDPELRRKALEDVDGLILERDQSLAGFETEVATLRGDLAGITAARDSLSTRVGQLDAQLAAVTQDRDGVATRIGQLDAQLAAVTRDRDGFAARIAQLEPQLATVTRDRDGFAARIAQLEPQVATLTRDRDGLAAQVGQVNAQLAAITQQRDGLSGQVNQLNTQLGQLNAQLGATAQQRDDANARLGQANSQLATMTQQRDGLATQVTQLNTQLGQASSQVASVTQQRDTLAAQANQLTSQLAAATQQRDSAVSQAGQLDTQLTQLRGQLATATQQRDGFSAQLGQLTSQLATATQQRDSFSAQVNQLTTQVGQLRGQLTAATQQRDAFSAQVGQLNTQLASVTQQRDGFSTQVNQLNTQVATLSATRDTLQRQVAESTAILRSGVAPDLALQRLNRTLGR
ncbi:coiled-coil domain-containing protein [Paracraurococcus ruber]|uniref:Chromosome segregation ATPase n=1 Tax=Paracraurococcus ruber TaxID=77675 RepID=A0ABS1D2C5_9PROT|nr:hypothetical protein [Paracraurococcus ruber]MBK1660983.1 hypothetical protein [Paracraurococcus ruber]